MSLSIATKGIIGVASASALGGASYGAYSYFNSSTSVKEELMKKQKTILNLTAIKGQADFEEWEELAKQYHGNKLRGKKEISGFSLTAADKIADLQAKCRTLLDSNSKSESYEKDLEATDDWCTKENAPKPIAKLLEGKNKVLLTEGGSENWKTQWEAFQATYKGKDLPDFWKFNDWTTKQKQTEAQSEFKKKCIENGKESLIPVREEALLSEIISFCTKNG